MFESFSLLPASASLQPPDVVHHFLPSHVLIRVLESLETKQRARASLVCKDWRTLVAASWDSIQLSFTSLSQLEQQRKWLDCLAAQSPSSVRAIEIHWRGGRLLHPAAGSLHVEKFVNLEKLYLKPPRSAYWAVNGKAIQSLRPLKRLRELILVFSPSQPSEVMVTLAEFAMFPCLRKLSVALQPCRGWEPGWQLDLSPALLGLKHLQSLTLSGAQKLLTSPTLRSLCAQLKHLDLKLREPLDEVIPAPNLVSLCVILCRSYGPAFLPFTAFQQLVDLQFNGSLHTSQLQNNQLLALQKLHLGSGSEQENGQQFLQLLGQLQDLRELKIVHDPFRQAGRDGPEEDPLAIESLAVFSTLTSLETLTLELLSPNSNAQSNCITISPSGSLSVLRHLDKLAISSVWQGAFAICLGDGIQHLQALRHLDLELQAVSAPLTSPSLTCLLLGRPHMGSMTSCPTFGYLPMLRCLHLRFLRSLQVCLQVSEQLGQMPLLQELLLVKGLSTVSPEVDRSEHDPPGTFEHLLISLGRCKSLQALQINAVNDHVSLSRKVLPGVQQFSLASRGLAVCPSFFAGHLPSLNLVFCTASQNTMKLLRSHTEISCVFWPDIHGDVWKATLVDNNRGTYEFDDGVFDAFCELDGHAPQQL